MRVELPVPLPNKPAAFSKSSSRTVVPMYPNGSHGRAARAGVQPGRTAPRPGVARAEADDRGADPARGQHALEAEAAADGMEGRSILRATTSHTIVNSLCARRRAR